MEGERLEKEKLERERGEREILETERLEMEVLERERERERLEKEKLDREILERFQQELLEKERQKGKKETTIAKVKIQVISWGTASFVCHLCNMKYIYNSTNGYWDKSTYDYNNNQWAYERTKWVTGKLVF
uniref:Uncharacterized protein n=1 Tax=Arcella intermedia TaxID=1963864 RepID=A0A6B2LPS4_9EUKA